jgi:hypothetical protein
MRKPYTKYDDFIDPKTGKFRRRKFTEKELLLFSRLSKEQFNQEIQRIRPTDEATYRRIEIMMLLDKQNGLCAKCGVRIELTKEHSALVGQELWCITCHLKEMETSNVRQ